MTNTTVQPARAPTFRHVILTRFNIRWDERPTGPSLGTNPEWLRDRFELFERYCVPSMLNQTRSSFFWLLFFDHETPPEFAERARSLATLHPGIRPVFCGLLTPEVRRRSIIEALPDQPEWLLTTRLDNDDGLHEDFLRDVQDAQRFERAEVINCPFGIALQGHRAYKQRHGSNAFISLSEPFADFQTVLSIARHVYASETYPIQQVGESPRWLQVIHGGNVSNRVRGRRLPFRTAAAGFPALETDVEIVESRSAILVENLTISLARSARDLLAMLARRSAKMIGVELRRKARIDAKVKLG